MNEGHNFLGFLIRVIFLGSLGGWQRLKLCGCVKDLTAPSLGTDEEGARIHDMLSMQCSSIGELGSNMSGLRFTDSGAAPCLSQTTGRTLGRLILFAEKALYRA